MALKKKNLFENIGHSTKQIKLKNTEDKTWLQKL